MRTRTALAAAAIPVFLLLSACGGGNDREDDAASPTPSATATASATPTAGTSAAAAKVTAQLQQALAAAHLATTEKDDKHLPCAVSFPRFYPADADHPKTRERIVASLTAAGWKTLPSNGTDESHLAGSDWELFVSRTKATGDDGTAYEMLDVAASCVDHTADDLFSR